MSRPNAGVQRFYRWNAPIYDWTRWVILRGRRAAVHALQLAEGQSVLEIGCGTGLNLPLLQGEVGASGCVVGIDLSLHMLARANRRAGANTHLICADAARLALGRKFDGVLLAYALTIIPDWRAALESAVAHVGPMGRLVVLDFGHTDGVFAIHRRMFEAYLHFNCVYPERDLAGVLSRVAGDVEILRPKSAYAMLLRWVRERPGAPNQTAAE